MYHPIRPLPQVVVDVAEDDVGTGGFVLFVAPPYLVGLFLPPVFGQEYLGFPDKKPRGFVGKNPGYSWVKTLGVSEWKPRVRFIYSHRSLFRRARGLSDESEWPDSPRSILSSTAQW